MARVLDTSDDRILVQEDRPVERTTNTIARIIYVITAIISALLIIRLLMGLLGANLNNGFAQFVYALTNPLVKPFVGLLSLQPQLGVARFEIETLIALVITVLVGYLLGALFDTGRRAV